MAQGDQEPPLPLEEAVVLLRAVKEEHAEADRALEEVLRALRLA